MIYYRTGEGGVEGLPAERTAKVTAAFEPPSGSRCPMCLQSVWVSTGSIHSSRALHLLHLHPSRVVLSMDIHKYYL